MKKIMMLLIAGLLFSNILYAQKTRFGISAGLTGITGSSAYSDGIENNGLGFGSNFNWGVLLRFEFPEQSPLSSMIYFNEHMLRGSGNVGPLGIKTSQNILSFGLEAQYNVLPLPVFKPYISAEINVNHFGDLTADSVKILFNYGSMTRGGIAIGIGTIFALSDDIGLDFSVKFNEFNLIGKSSDEPSINSYSINLALLF